MHGVSIYLELLLLLAALRCWLCQSMHRALALHRLAVQNLHKTFCFYR